MTNSVPVVKYKPLSERVADTQFQDLVRKILFADRWNMPVQGVASCQIAGAELRFNMSNGFPLMTERDMICPIPRKGKEDWPSIFSQSIAEMVAFVNGARTQDEYEAHGCFWWRRWLTKAKCEYNHLEEGDNGVGSYGAVLTNFPTHQGEPHNGKPFDQIDAVFEEMKRYPGYRTHVITTWCPPYTYAGDNRKVVVAPCHGTVVQFQLDEERKELTLVHVQRSCDILVGGIGNICQYAAIFGLAAAKILGYTFVEYIHYMVQPHIYENQLEGTKEVLGRSPRAFPTVTLVGEIASIKDLRPEHFVVEEYDPHPYFNIPTPI